MRGERETEKAESAEGQAGKDAAAFAETTDERADEKSGDDAGAYAYDGEREADVAFGPCVAILRVEDEDGGERLLGKIEEGHDGGETEQLGVRTQKREGPQRVSHVPGGL